MEKRKTEKELQTKKIRLGVYEHYSGRTYDVIGVARHSETLEEVVVYRARYGKKIIWVRPIKMFFEKIEKEGKKVPRFKKLV